MRLHPHKFHLRHYCAEGDLYKLCSVFGTFDFLGNKNILERGIGQASGMKFYCRIKANLTLWKESKEFLGFLILLRSE